jgi:hypothetical protein
MNKVSVDGLVALLDHPSGAVRVHDYGDEGYAYQLLPASPSVRGYRGALGALTGAAGGLAINKLLAGKSPVLGAVLGAGLGGTILAANPRMQSEVAYAQGPGAGDYVRSAAAAAVSGANEPSRGDSTLNGLYTYYAGLPKVSNARRVWDRLVDGT